MFEKRTFHMDLAALPSMHVYMKLDLKEEVLGFSKASQKFPKRLASSPLKRNSPNANLFRPRR